MPGDSEPERLLAIAGAIAEGSDVDWMSESSHREPVDADLLSELRDVERIVAAHRDPGFQASDSPPPIEPAPYSVGAWRHLTLIESIGKGSFGVVYRAHDEQLATDVALKLTPSATRESAAPLPGALKEAQLLARVRHANVVRVYGADHVDGQAGIWMELIVGHTFERILNAQGPLSAREAAFVGIDVARAVAAVHRVGLVHGDIKSANVMREEGGRTVLMDFSSSYERSSARRRGTEVRGTPAYVAPEVFAGAELSQASDVYAMGVLLFRLASGEYPVIAPSVEEIVRIHERGTRRLLRDVRPDLPDEFIRVVERATSSQRERYRTPGELEAALARFIDPSGHVAPASATRWRRYVAAAAVLTTLALGWLWLRPAALPSASYDIEAAFYRSTDTVDEPLKDGQRLSLGDHLSFVLQTTVPAFLYIVNEPEQGEPFLLFPLPGQTLQNPLPPGTRVRVPESVDWQVTSAGGREHFVVFVSPQRVEAFEQVFAAFASPRAGEPVTRTPLPVDAIDQLRGIGGLSPSRPALSNGPRFSMLFTTPLTGQKETARGLWVRLLTLDNPQP